MTDNVVALAWGPKNPAVVKALQPQVDSVSLMGYMSVGEMISEFNSKKIFPKRIIVSAKTFQDADAELEELYRYVLDSNPGVKVVLICDLLNQDGSDAKFMAKFKTSSCTPVLAEKIGVPELVFLTMQPVPDIRARYYKKEDIVVPELSAGFALAEEERQAPPQEAAPAKKKKKGLFGFGRGKDIPEIAVPADNTAETVNSLSSAMNVEAMNSLLIPHSPIPAVGGLVGGYGDASVSASLAGIRPVGAAEEETDFTFDELLGGGFSEGFSETGLLEEEPEEEYIEEAPQQAQEWVQQEWVEPEAVVEEEPNPFGEPVLGFELPYAGDVSNDGFKIEEFSDGGEVYQEQGQYTPDVGVGAGGGYFTVPTARKVVVVTGDNSVGVTSQCSMMAVESNESGHRTLVVELDELRHGFLTNLGFSDIANTIWGDNIQTGRVVDSEGISILSNGYNTGITEDDYEAILSGEHFHGYNKVIIDCPIRNLGKLKALLPTSEVVVLVAGSYMGLTNLARCMEDRNLIDDDLMETLSEVGKFSAQNCANGFENDLSEFSASHISDRFDWLKEVA